MISKINNKELETAKEVQMIFQASYLVEAKLLKAQNFPPLNRTISNIAASTTEFYAIRKNDILTGLIEVNSEGDCTDINSLVVHPSYFRKGLAKELMKFILASKKASLFTVETGVENKPAIALYESFGFIKEKEWDTSFGIRKIKLIKKGIPLN